MARVDRFILVLIALAALCCGVGYFMHTRIRLENAFGRGEQWAIQEVAQKGRAIVPQMLDGLHDPDLGRREACRKVLFAMWGQLTGEERKGAALGQFRVEVIDAHRSGQDDGQCIIFTLRVFPNFRGNMSLDGRDTQLFVDGKAVANFAGEFSCIDMSPGSFTTTLELPSSVVRASLSPNAQVYLSGCMSFMAEPRDAQLMSGTPADAPRQPLGSGEFSLDWTTPTKRVSDLFTDTEKGPSATSP
jgi:hypothetical protein